MNVYVYICMRCDTFLAMASEACRKNKRGIFLSGRERERERERQGDTDYVGRTHTLSSNIFLDIERVRERERV